MLEYDAVWDQQNTTDVAQFLSKFPSLLQLSLGTSLTSLTIRLAGDGDLAKVAVTSDLAMPAKIEMLHLSPIASQEDAIAIAKRIPSTIQTLELYCHITTAAIEGLAKAPHPHLTSLKLIGVQHGRPADLIAALGCIVPTLKELSIKFNNYIDIDGLTWGCMLQRAPNLRELQVDHFMVNGRGLAAILDSLPGRTLRSLHLDVVGARLEEIKACLKARLDDWADSCFVLIGNVNLRDVGEEMQAALM
ncbi:hypothetical protein GGF32_001796 [Allomyces javanicus]|nr:hypothetical protein GGF32_001796 [Allomyces javanicus]